MIFNQSKYTNWYHKIIENAKTRNLKGYGEKHHIIPKCLGGSNLADNIVKLTAKEHYVCHRLLTNMTNGLDRRKMLFAIWRMMHGNNYQHRYEINSRSYDVIKSAMAIEISSQNNGYKQSEETVMKMRKRIPWNKGKTGVMPESAKQQISNSRKGTKTSAETRLKISESAKAAAVTSKKKYQSGKIRFRWVLKNTKSGTVIETVNLRRWCSDNNINSGYIYTNRSDWVILEKYQYKNNIRMI